MRTVVVVENEVVMQADIELWHRLVAFEVNVFILHRSPQPFHEDVVQGSALAIHADANFGCGQDGSESFRCELTAL